MSQTKVIYNPKTGLIFIRTLQYLPTPIITFIFFIVLRATRGASGAAPEAILFNDDMSYFLARELFVISMSNAGTPLKLVI